MVGDTRGTADTRRVRRLKPPRDIEVEAAADGTPLRLRLAPTADSGKSVWQDVALVRHPWRIDQHWWRPGLAGSPRPELRGISRIYYRVAPEDGPPLTVYRDLLTNEWRQQEY